MRTNPFAKKNLLIPYFTLGDPNLNFTYDLVRAAFLSGADAVELGIPFSDPLADGPVIQSSHFRALTNNPDINLDHGFELVRKIRAEFNKPIIFMLATNLVFHFGINNFFVKANECGLAGVVIPDLSLEDSLQYYQLSKKYQVPLIYLASPLISEERIIKITAKAEGFIYLISSLGTTGERNSFSSTLKKVTDSIKKIKEIPVVVGFGISKKEHLEEIYQFADGAIIGSYFVRIIENNLSDLDQAIKLISNDIKILKWS
ncbi:MAG: tryptophan synthase subunit alpha [Candidatus Margulisiibacteriota bacterium]|jgi:tryptophan synthase alpha chain